MSPIEAFILAGGETVGIVTPAASQSKNYDPDAPGSWTPGTPGTLTYEGITGKWEIGDLPQGANAAFTISATSLPAGLTAMQSLLLRTGHPAAIIHSWRERFYVGAIDGYTLFLAA